MSMASMSMRWTSSLIRKSYLTPVTKIMNQQMKILGQGQRNLLQLKGYEALLEKSNRGKLKRNTTTEVVELFNVNRHAVWRIWRQAKQCRANGVPVDDSSRKSKNYGSKKVEIDTSQVETIPLHRRCTIRSLAQALGMKKP